MAFSTCGIDNALDNANGDGNAKLPPHACSRVSWERRTAISAAASSVAVKNHGWEFTPHVMLFFTHIVEVDLIKLCQYVEITIKLVLDNHS